MFNFLDTLAGLKTRVTGLTANKVLGAPPGEVTVRSSAVQLGAHQAAASSNRGQDGEIPEVQMLFWGEPKPGGGVTIFTSKEGFALLQDESESVRFQAAHRIARWVMSQQRWRAANSPRSQNSVVNEILCHAHWVNDDPDMSVEYVVDSTQQVGCLLIGFPLGEDPPSGTPVPDEGVV